MRKLQNILILLGMGIMLSALASPGHAFFLTKLLQGPVQLPMPDPADEVASTMQSLGQTAASGYKTYNAAQNQVNNLRTALNSVYDFDFSATVDGTLNPGSRKISTCSINGKKIDVYDAASVEDAFQYLFFQYPHHTQVIIYEYDNNRRRFYQDNLIEIYTASQQLELDLEERVKPTLSSASDCVRNGGCGIPAADGNTESLYSLSKALEAMDNVLMLLQKAEALKAQLAAVKAMNSVRPLSYRETIAKTADEVIPETKEGGSIDEEQEASLPAKIYASASSGGSISLAFAQAEVAQALSAAESSAQDNDYSQSYIDRLIFNTAPASDIFHPYLDEEEKMAQLDMLNPVESSVTAAMDVHNVIHDLPNYQKAAQTYRETEEKYKKALEALQASEKCALRYVGRHFKDADQTWAGGNFLENPTAHEQRKGISGWAVEAFEVAKAAKASSADTDDVVVLDIDEDETDLSDISDTAKAQAVLDKNQAVSASTSKQEKTVAENREISLVSWQVGAEASKLLANSPEEWGTVKEKFPVWNDTKSFYNQYLSGKYANIKSYLKMFSREDIVAIVIARLQGEDKDPLETLRSKEAASADTELSGELSGLSEERTQSLQQYESDVQSGLAILQKKRESIQARLDEAYEAMKTASDELSDLRQAIRDSSVEELKDSVTEYESYPDVTTEETVSPQAFLQYNSSVYSRFGIAFAAVADAEELAKSYQENVSSNKQKVAAEIKELEQRFENQKQKVEQYEEELKAVDEEIKRYKLQNQGKLSNIQKKYNEDARAAADRAAADKAAASEDYAVAVKANLESLIDKLSEDKKLTDPLTFLNLESKIGARLDALYAKVDARIDQAQNELGALGDELYDPAAYDKIVDIHDRMISDIKLLSLSFSGIKGLEGIQAIQLYAKLLAADTSAEQEDYFVGNPAKERDLKAPKQIFTQNLPPLREFVHFDETDFQNVTPYIKGTQPGGVISANDFLNYGGEIPEVWKYMLRANTFVEKDMDLKSALNGGCPEEAFYRGGIFPCKVKDSAFVLDINANGEFVKSSAAQKDLADCPYLEARNGGVYHLQQEVFLDLNKSSSLGIPLPAKQPAAVDCPYSELGTLLNADEHNNLFFREGVFNAFYTLIESQNNAEGELSDAQKKQLVAYENAPLAADQIGDFLKYAENEQILRKTLEEVEFQYEQLVDNIREILKTYGYEASEDLDLSDEEDYNLVRSKLDNIKNQNIADALTAAEEVDAAENPVVEERLGRLNAMIAALQKDRDEQIVITTAIVDDNDIDEELKSSKVNEEVASKFEKSLNNLQQLLDLPAAPYCANY